MPGAVPSPDTYGAGSFLDQAARAIPDDARRVFEILARATPGFTQDPRLWDSVSFDGGADPIVPGALKTPVVAAALHAMCGVVANELLEHRDGHASGRRVLINTDHAALWLGTVAITKRNGLTVAELAKANKLAEIFEKNLENGIFGTPLKLRATAVYPTGSPGVWYQLHGSLNADAVLEAIGLDPETPCEDVDEAYRVISHHVSKFGADELEMINVKKGLCGSICYTPERWRQTQMSRALSRHPLVNNRLQSYAIPTPVVAIPPVSTDKRPLAGIKVIELVRIIAGPVIGSTLAALGADVIRVNSSRLPDFNSLQLTLNAGIRTVDLDINQDDDLTRMKELVKDADVFVQGYRPGSTARYGLGLQNLLEMAGKRGRGIVYVEENCYGPDGPFHDRPGWQQVADAASGCAYVTGRSLGHEDGTCVLPALPAPDMMTGLVGAIGAMMAIRDRARNGGSYHVFSSLLAAAAFPLQPEIGLYSPGVVQKCNERFEWDAVNPALFVLELLDVVLRGWKRVFPEYFAADSPWITTLTGPWGNFQLLEPVLRLADSSASPRWLTAPEPNCCHKSGTISWLCPEAECTEPRQKEYSGRGEGVVTRIDREI
ncbi:hypothetical protein LTR02_014596 [Friedmanniomyces endolithicus]|nr:hypothetical protein LTR94_023666 [Friedmanniomyces endolithicus]KAK0768037.1 hypothetical protein LTR59_017971 [Friedmanniomyces endolithicus]KAK0769208.1 hypothetical protein LTR38_017941 [Friedmanniomyces endolithicus]KAK0770672.1 hypothetical protein LTR75_017858 [Friedmanniomyces endolithicus]KAK0823563.1 hypothetical protein LTR03_017914 [Friedmanniomyces endolithicus]